ncbi:MAG: glycosyltransferase family 9 protein [Gammaproteobacteria bacterium]|nr:glycosyltransferase family 9 protein [Gammaproteobacteria bacterium]
MSIEPESIAQDICLIRLSAIGDTCHVLPVIRTLKAKWPASRFTWIIGKVEASLMQGIDDVELVIFDKSRGWRAFGDVRNALRGRRFDVLLHMHASMRANIVSLNVRAHTRLGFDRVRGRDYQWLFTNQKIAAKQRRHVLDGLFEFAEHLGVEERELRWDIPVSDADREFAQRHIDLSRPTLVISPCSSQRFRNFRNWSVSNYAAVADYAAQQYSAQLLISGGNSELEEQYAKDIIRTCHTDPVNLVGRTSLKQLLCVLEAATVVICPDSGPAHMACAVQTPVIGLYATSNRFRTGPYLYQDLVVDKYPQAVAQEFGKSPDDLPWGQRVRNPNAMDLIEVDEVKAKLDRVLGG